MNLLPPRILGPISECSELIWVQGQMPGSSVEIVDDAGVVVAIQTVSSADTTIDVTAALVAGRELAARQVMGSDDSGLSPETVEVQARPGTLGPAVLPNALFQCARCVLVDGLLPGAEVRISQSGVNLGVGSSVKGYARVSLSQALSSATVVIEQVACGIDGDTASIQPANPPADDKQGNVLPAPNVESPLHECRTRLTISEVYPGARVELERSMGPNGSACFDSASLWWRMNPPLMLGESVRARQIFLECEKFSEWSTPPVPVGELQPVPVPHIVEPLCAEGTTVRIGNLFADATVKVIITDDSHHGLVGGQSYYATAPEDGIFDFIVPAPGLMAGGLVCATQTLCSRESELSSAVMVTDAPEVLIKPVVEEPLYACSITVRVSNLHPGTRVYVSAADVGVIGEAHVISSEMDITVRPVLVKGQKITAVAIGCGLESEISDPVDVQEAPTHLPAPRIIEPVNTCDRFVQVRDLIPGATVDVYVNGTWSGRGMAGADADSIAVQILPLEVGDQVYAIQHLCDVYSDRGSSVTVVVFDGEWEVLRDSLGAVIEDKSEILAVHAALLPSGWIVIFSGDDYTNDNQPIDNTRLMLGESPWTVESVSGIPDGYNLFCCGHSLLADGSVLTGGGTESRPPSGLHTMHWLGLRGSLRFQPAASGVWSWETQGDMVTARPGDFNGDDASDSGGRWYPSLITLPNGHSLAIGGHPLNGDRRHTNTTLETYNPSTRQWSYVGSSDYQNIPGWDEAIRRRLHSEYPSLHVLPDNTVFAASAMADGDMWKWNIGDDANDWVYVSSTPSGYGGNPQPITSVLLPLRFNAKYSSRVLLYGREQSYTIDPEATLPTAWFPTSARQLPSTPERIYPLATMLPTGEVFISGGTQDGNDNTAILQPEIYDSNTGEWRYVEEGASQIRNYHSTALLLADGSVWHSGGNVDCRPSSSSDDTRNRTVEIYRPWYFCWPRPKLEQVTARVRHGEEFSIITPDAANINEVVLVRLSSFTHAFNPDQRHIELEFARDPENADRLRAFMPRNPAVAIVGYYLCFVLDENRVPSIGQFIQVRAAVPLIAEFVNPFQNLNLAELLRENGNNNRRLLERAIQIAALLPNEDEENDDD